MVSARLSSFQRPYSMCMLASCKGVSRHCVEKTQHVRRWLQRALETANCLLERCYSSCKHQIWRKPILLLLISLTKLYNVSHYEPALQLKAWWYAFSNVLPFKIDSHVRENKVLLRLYYRSLSDRRLSCIFCSACLYNNWLSVHFHNLRQQLLAIILCRQFSFQINHCQANL